MPCLLRERKSPGEGTLCPSERAYGTRREAAMPAFLASPRPYGLPKGSRLLPASEFEVEVSGGTGSLVLSSCQSVERAFQVSKMSSQRPTVGEEAAVPPAPYTTPAKEKQKTSATTRERETRRFMPGLLSRRFLPCRD